MKVKVGEIFSNELGSDGKLAVPDDAFLVVSYDELEEWYEAEDSRPLACRVVMPGCTGWDELANAKREMEEGR